MMNFKRVIIGILVIVCIFIGITIFLNKSDINGVSDTSDDIVASGDIKYIEGLEELKNKSDLIVEVVGTNEREKRDYKGSSSIVSKVKVKEVFKGDKSLKEVKVIQVENLDIVPDVGQSLVMFLRSGEDNPDCYGVVGAGQGIYKIEDNKLTHQAMENKDILKDLEGNYEEVKNKLE